mmetsp:Transcript_86851/g.280585  ORF Transcript_86851/g.280585 Transcript_86851/m.280585 type:complete len:286 (+) Transcript_86851:142-999(+)
MKRPPPPTTAARAERLGSATLGGKTDECGKTSDNGHGARDRVGPASPVATRDASSTKCPARQRRRLPVVRSSSGVADRVRLCLRFLKKLRDANGRTSSIRTCPDACRPDFVFPTYAAPVLSSFAASQCAGLVTAVSCCSCPASCPSVHSSSSNAARSDACTRPEMLATLPVGLAPEQLLATSLAQSASSDCVAPTAAAPFGLVRDDVEKPVSAAPAWAAFFAAPASGDPAAAALAAEAEAEADTAGDAASPSSTSKDAALGLAGKLASKGPAASSRAPCPKGLPD